MTANYREPKEVEGFKVICKNCQSENTELCLENTNYDSETSIILWLRCLDCKKEEDLYEVS